MKAQLSLALGIIATTAPAWAEISGSGHRVEGCDGVIESRVWNDANGNGIQDAGEPPLVGVALSLLRSDDPELGEDTLHTDGAGQVRFFNLCLEDHELRVRAETLPPGMEPVVGLPPLPDEDDGEDGDSDDAPRRPLDSDATASFAPVTIELDDDFVVEVTVDFGFWRPGCAASAGDRVWLDNDGDGLQSAGERGLAGVTVALAGANGETVDVAMSDGRGRYRFAGVCDGAYSVTIDESLVPLDASPAQQGDDATIDSDPPAGAAWLAQGDRRDDIDFAFNNGDCQGAVLGDIYDDGNADGERDPGEDGIPGVKVTLQDPAAGGTTLREGLTDGQGRYRLAGLCAGDYSVSVDAATITGFASPTVGTGDPLPVQVASDQAESALPPLGFARGCRGQIGDRVWIDTDGDGQQGAAEVGIEGVWLELRDSQGRLVGQRRTGATGHYVFDGLCAGSYALQVDASTVPAGLTPTVVGQGDPALDSLGATPQWLTLVTNSGVIDGADFGFVSGECVLSLSSRCGALPWQASGFECKEPIDTLSMVWAGRHSVRIVAHAGDEEEPVLADLDAIAPGDVVTVAGYEDAPKDVVWVVYEAGTNTPIGRSWFRVDCDDDDMDGPEDCGLPQGDGKDGNRCDDGEVCVTDWRLTGLIDKHTSLDCVPDDPATTRDCMATVGRWVAVEHMLLNAGGAVATQVVIDDDAAPALREQPMAALQPGEMLSYVRAFEVEESFGHDVLVSAGACGTSARTTVSAVPAPACIVYGESKLRKSKDKIKWRLRNAGSSDLTVEKISVSWHPEHDELKEVSLADKFVDRNVAPSQAIFTDAEMVPDRNKRRFERGKKEDLEVKFEEDSEHRVDGDYTITIDFEEGCSVSFDTKLP